MAKAREAQTPEELMALAQQNNIEITWEEAKNFFDKIHAKSGELEDDELDNVSAVCQCVNGKKVWCGKASHQTGGW